MPTDLFWFKNDGGPLCVVPRHPSPQWEGGDPPSGGRTVEARARVSGTDIATDYDRACDCSDVTLLSAGNGWVLVLPGAEDAAAWLPSTDTNCAALVFAFGRPEDDSLEALLSLRRAQPDGAWRTVADRVMVGPGGLVLMHAADRLETVSMKHAEESPRPFVGIGDGIEAPVAPGSYLVRACQYESSNRYSDATFVNFELVP